VCLAPHWPPLRTRVLVCQQGRARHTLFERCQARRFDLSDHPLCRVALARDRAASLHARRAGCRRRPRRL